MTTDPCPEIALAAIDTEHLEDVEDNREAVSFYVQLCAKPSEVWIQEFDEAYKATPYLLKPPVTVMGDRLHVTFLPRYSEELPGFFRFLALIVKRATEETRQTEALHTSGDQEKRRTEFREALRRIELPKV